MIGRESTVEAAVPIAIRELGESGPPILLLHGGSRTLEDWQASAEVLARAHRVISVDLRGHGRSGTGRWTWDEAVADVRAVSESCDARDALIVGQSLGGMLAARYLVTWDDCPGAINLDGANAHLTHLYDGLTEGEVWSRLAELDRRSPSSTLSVAQLSTMREALVAQGAALGLIPALLSAGIDRALRGEPGQQWLAPTDEVIEDFVAEVHSLDLLGLYATIPRPLHVVVATRRFTPAELPGMPWLDDFMHRMRTGLFAAVRSLAATNPMLGVSGLDAHHLVQVQRPAEVAALIESFSAGVLPQPAPS